MQMNRSYRVILQGGQSQSFVMAGSAKEAAEIAAKAVHNGEQVTIEDPEHNIISADRLSEIVKESEAQGE
jgi:hypothetical protein